MHVAKSFDFRCVRHNTSTNKCSTRIKKLPIILQLNFLQMRDEKTTKL